ncbi:FAD-containing monooxygenase EthA [Paraconexibacter sp. AEG42_29]|uniref:FAD-containing monooxygenase EthA n=1 Tax=Paraconexibacter sp. AEG42_29 TaxID=2997339 RepID=A0AAU7B1P3_9ACTN
MSLEHFDVLIVGAGLSGIGAAHHLQESCPGKSYAILESRERIGGTWDLFRYPGIRSDSDMHTLGYRFRPWTSDKAIADGPAILSYVRDTAREGGIDRHIRFGLKVVGAEWSSTDARWTVTAESTAGGEPSRFTCGFLFTNTGYYRYDEGFTPAFPGLADFEGTVVHPQHWPEDLDYAGKKVVVIGSGATAVTLVPAMAEQAAHVTMLQRSPTYIVSMPDEDPIAKALGRVLPAKVAYPIVRWKNVGLATLSYQVSQRRPALMKKFIKAGVTRQLSPDYDVDTHFTPRYNPWDQRLCLVPNGDLFRVLRKGRASIVTDHIETFTPSGIRLQSGAELEADIIVTATGLNLLALGGMQFTVDGKQIALPDLLTYKGMMLSGLPNFAFTIGYTNASWTLKADLTSAYICRLLNHMDAGGFAIAVPENHDRSVTEEPFMDFQAGYVLRALDAFPKQGSKAPWKLRQNYARDLVTLRRGQIADAGMVFQNPAPAPAVAAAAEPVEPTPA